MATKKLYRLASAAVEPKKFTATKLFMVLGVDSSYQSKTSDHHQGLFQSFELLAKGVCTARARRGLATVGTFTSNFEILVLVWRGSARSVGSPSSRSSKGSMLQALLLRVDLVTVCYL